MTTRARTVTVLAGFAGVALTAAAWFIFPPGGPFAAGLLIAPIASGVAWLGTLLLFWRRAQRLGHTRLRQVMMPAVAAAIVWLLVGAIAVPAGSPEDYIANLFWTVVITSLMGIVLIPFVLGIALSWLFTRPDFTRNPTQSSPSTAPFAQ
ncbi:hypothetical protein [Leucobacter luti]|uniref:hypothetical protein n=1 Tax=Leucobacter luti TaxID=340320 RepID=UPI001C6923B0|nr:hypothetical protein [Leucobacter luti]QYM75979.1 hypothetical protein K1X41_00325 [Leucobacter luti]